MKKLATMTMRKKGSWVAGTGTLHFGGVAAVGGDEDECDLTELNSGVFDDSVGEGECIGKDACGDHGYVQTVGIVVLRSSSRPHCGRYPSYSNVGENEYIPLTTEAISWLLLILLPISLLP
jgi:hypothetical protein